MLLLVGVAFIIIFVSVLSRGAYSCTDQCQTATNPCVVILNSNGGLAPTKLLLTTVACRDTIESPGAVRNSSSTRVDTQWCQAVPSAAFVVDCCCCCCCCGAGIDNDDDDTDDDDDDAT